MDYRRARHKDGNYFFTAICLARKNMALMRKIKGHVGLGGGVHLCLGNAIARLATKSAMEVFLTEIPHFSQVEADDALEWLASSNFRSPKKLVLVRQ